MRTNMTVEARQLEKIVRNIERNLGTLVRDVSSEVYGELTQDPRSFGAGTGTPRDTRRATNGWNISTNGPNYDDPGEGQYGEPPGAHQEAHSQIRKGTMNASISNGVPYIAILDTGTSTQAPAGFVRRAVNRAVNWLIGFDVLDKNFGIR
jgi:hypothetical protein